MSTTTKTPHIKVKANYYALPPGDLLARATAVDKGIPVPAPATLPIDPVAYGALVASYGPAIAAALDGGKQAIAAANQIRASIIKDLQVLGPFAAANANGDMAVFHSTGFEAISLVRTPAAALIAPFVVNITQGTTGQLLIKISYRDGAKSYDVRNALLTNGVPGQWTITTVTRAKSAVPINGLTPTMNYAFQVRALGNSGYTDWSDSATRICI